VQVNKQENKSYDQEFENKYGQVNMDNFIDTDFGAMISREFKKLASAPYSSKNAYKRYQENGMERFQDTKVCKKLQSVYFPVDKS